MGLQPALGVFHPDFIYQGSIPTPLPGEFAANGLCCTVFWGIFFSQQKLPYLEMPKKLFPPCSPISLGLPVTNDRLMCDEGLGCGVAAQHPSLWAGQSLLYNPSTHVPEFLVDQAEA